MKSTRIRACGTHVPDVELVGPESRPRALAEDAEEVGVRRSSDVHGREDVEATSEGGLRGLGEVQLRAESSVELELNVRRGGAVHCVEAECYRRQNMDRYKTCGGNGRVPDEVDGCRNG